MIQCSPESASFFSRIPDNLRPYLCTLYTGIRDLRDNPGADALTSRLLCFGAIFNTVLLFESHRQTSWLGRRATSIFTSLAHLLSGAVSAPFYFANIYSDREKLGERSERAVTAGEAWSVPLSVTFGYLVPLYMASKAEWSNTAITCILFFPLYLSVLNTILPRILRPRLDGTSVRLAILCSMLISACTASYAPQLFFGRIPFREILWPYHAPPVFVRDLHILLLHDYIFASIGFLIYTTLRLKEVQHDLTDWKFMGFAAFIAICNQLDPAFIITMLWASAELRRAKPVDNPIDRLFRYESNNLQRGEGEEAQGLLDLATEE